jgi:hypothetical protein
MFSKEAVAVSIPTSCAGELLSLVITINNRDFHKLSIFMK